MSERQSRSSKKREGEQSQRLAKALMELTEAQLAPLKLDDDLKDEVRYSLTQTADGARRREQRRLGSILRRYDLDEVEAVVAILADAAKADATRFRRAERWRTRLLDEGAAALSAFADDAGEFDRAELEQAISDGQHEIEHATPKGAQRKLFRLVRAALDAKAEPTTADASNDDAPAE